MPYTFRVNTEAAREKCLRLIASLPFGKTVVIRDEKRSAEQNDKMWAMLTDLSRQCYLDGRRRPPSDWKVVVMHALDYEQRFIPSLDGQSYIPLGYRSTGLTKGEMSDLIEFIYKYGAENGVQWSDERTEK